MLAPTGRMLGPDDAGSIESPNETRLGLDRPVPGPRYVATRRWHCTEWM